MVEITLKNGSKIQIKNLIFQGKIIDSNGTEAGGNTSFVFTESEVNALDKVVNFQQAYTAITTPVVEELEGEPATE